MKFGIDAPWYDDPAERMAFNLYAMQHEELDALADKIANIENPNWEGIKEYYNLSSYEMNYLQNKINGD